MAMSHGWAPQMPPASGAQAFPPARGRRGPSLPVWTWVLVISLTVVLGGLQATLFAVALATAPESLRTTVFDDATPIWVLGVGDCIAGDPVDDSVDGTVTSANVVPCDQPHEFEVFAADAIEHDPDFDEPDIAAAANEFCLSQFSGYVGTGYQSSALELLTLYPDGVAWSEGDADVTCILESPESVTASLRGSEGTSARAASARRFRTAA